ncbi:DUF7344 domain-containing protein [Halobellus inordinatus]|uniref:DUF7344 domain-containing protein n=1 Tax=Halobellus inordinatus TaxID=1126236 RepID=UPI00210D4FBF|nr:hypothetical protein [Halobellus inordinatus]
MNPDGDGGELTATEALKLLAGDEQRHILKELLERGPGERVDLLEAETLREIAEQTSRETADTGANANVDIERLEVELRHNHLPRLAEQNIIEWDEKSGSITRGSNFERVRPFIERLGEYSDELPDDW